MLKKIYYWNTIFNKELINQYPHILAKLESGDYKSADLDLKKSRSGASLYTVRLNDADRLLLTTIEDASHQPAIMLLEVIYNHDYQKSRFLKPAVLSAFLKNKAPEIIAKKNFKEQDFVASAGDELIAIKNKESDEPAEYVAANYYNHHFIEFNDMQENALSATLPLIVSGAAGSGKSCIAISLLASKAVEKSGLKEDARLLYVTQSEPLVRSMRQLWHEHPAAGEAGISVEFKTYQDLLQEYNPNLQEQKIIGEKEFELWLRDYIKKVLTVAKTKKNSNLVHFLLQRQNLNTMYQEFRLISGYSQEQYFALGQRQSNFDDRQHREWLWQAYQDYQKMLEQQRQYDPAFVPLAANDQYDFVVNDEAQDNSHLQTRVLFGLAKDEAFACCTDNHQDIVGYLSKRPYLEKLSAKMQSVELPGSYRCPTPVINLANQILSLKFILTGGTSDKTEKTKVGTQYSNDGRKVQWVNPSPEVTEKLKETTSIRSDWAVISQEADKAEVKKIFDTDLVFTAPEIKGLEYKGVIVYQPLNQDLFRQANKDLTEKTGSKNQNIHRAKAGESHPEYAPILNQFFTAITRTTHQLVILQAKSHAVEKVSNYIQEGLAEASVNKPLTLEKQTASTREEWEAEAKRLILHDQEEAAKGICIRRLKWSESEFKSFVVRTRDFAEANKQTPPEQKNQDVAQASSSKRTTSSKGKQKIESNRPEANKQTSPEPKNQDAAQASSSKKTGRNKHSAFAKLQRTEDLLTPPSKPKYDAFLRACAKGNLKKVSKYLAAKKDIFPGDSRPISFALTKKDYVVVKVLLEAGYAVPQDKFHDPLLYFVFENDIEAVENLLLQIQTDLDGVLEYRFYQPGANVNAADADDGFTALHLASFKGYDKIVTILLEKGADVNIRDQEGCIPLHTASCYGHNKIIEILIENGAEINILNNSGKTPLDSAYQYDHKETIDLLIAKGAKTHIELSQVPAIPDSHLPAQSDEFIHFLNSGRCETWSDFLKSEYAKSGSLGNLFMFINVKYPNFCINTTKVALGFLALGTALYICVPENKVANEALIKMSLLAIVVFSLNQFFFAKTRKQVEERQSLTFYHNSEKKHPPTYSNSPT